MNEEEFKRIIYLIKSFALTLIIPFIMIKIIFIAMTFFCIWSFYESNGLGFCFWALTLSTSSSFVSQAYILFKSLKGSTDKIDKELKNKYVNKGGE